MITLINTTYSPRLLDGSDVNEDMKDTIKIVAGIFANFIPLLIGSIANSSSGTSSAAFNVGLSFTGALFLIDLYLLYKSKNLGEEVVEPEWQDGVVLNQEIQNTIAFLDKAAEATELNKIENNENFLMGKVTKLEELLVETRNLLAQECQKRTWGAQNHLTHLNDEISESITLLKTKPRENEKDVARDTITVSVLEEYFAQLKAAIEKANAASATSSGALVLFEGPYGQLLRQNHQLQNGCVELDTESAHAYVAQNLQNFRESYDY